MTETLQTVIEAVEQLSPDEQLELIATVSLSPEAISAQPNLRQKPGICASRFYSGRNQTKLAAQRLVTTKSRVLA